jgi:A/G-specific adenine glycosylase
VPDDVALLLELPGIGAYTARAVAAFAFGQRQPVVDTNVRRLMARAHSGLAEAAAATTAADFLLVEGLLPERAAAAARASIAFMELGALVCTARQPSCDVCPLWRDCAWRLAGQPPSSTSRPAQRYVGTDRQARGVVLALCRTSASGVTRRAIAGAWPDADQRRRALVGLLEDGLIVDIDGDRYGLPGMGATS